MVREESSFDTSLRCREGSLVSTIGDITLAATARGGGGDGPISW